MAAEVEEFQGLQRVGVSRVEILTEMKSRGLTIAEAIKASMQVFGVGLGEAKSIVASHPAWLQTARASEPLRDTLIRSFQEAESSGMLQERPA